jgi:acylphosphatase
MIKTYRFIVSGRVQGVGFRYFVEEKAKKFGIMGYVKNTPDNKVEILCQAGELRLDLFFDEIKKGPTFSNVSDIIKETVETGEILDSFTIRY